MAKETKIQDLILQCRVGSPMQKATAIVELEEMRAREAVPVLLDLLDFPDAAIRASAVDALGILADLRDRTAGSALVPLLKDPYSLVRANTAESLGLLQVKESVGELMLTLQTDEDALVRLCAAEALGRLRDHSSLPTLIEALSDLDAGVRGYAADSVGALGAEAKVLIQKLSHEKSGFVKAFIFSALYRLGEEKYFAGLINLLESADETLSTTIENLIDELGMAIK